MTSLKLTNTWSFSSYSLYSIWFEACPKNIANLPLCPSFWAPSLRMWNQHLDPITRKLTTSGIFPVHFSNCVLFLCIPAHETLLRMWIAVTTASAQKRFGVFRFFYIALVNLRRVRFMHSARPFCCGVWEQLSLRWIPLFFKYVANSWLF